MLWNRLCSLLVLFVALGAVLCVMQAQTVTTGDVSGVITDSSGGVVPNATVTVKSLETGEARTVQSGPAGAYRFSFLMPSAYQVSAASTGLKSSVARVTVAVGQVASVDLVMKPESEKTVIEVTESATMLQTENADITASYNSRSVELLPMPGGDITTLAFSVPGVVMSTAGSGASGYGSFSSYGLPATANLFTMNGNDNMDPYLNLNNSGATNLTLGANEVSQAVVIQNAYSGEYGRQAGAQVNYITKSGSNDFHGNLSYQWNGRAMNANDFYANATGTPRPFSNSNQYGAAVGGRIIKNKLFFFFNTEGLRYVLPSTETNAFPSQALQTYVLGNISAAQKPLYQSAFSLWNGAPGRSRAVAVTTGDGPLQDSSGTLGCGSLAGTPTGTGGVFGTNVSCADAFNSSLSNKNPEWLMTTRIDWVINQNQKINWRFKQDHGLQATSTSPLTPLFNRESNQPSYEGQISHIFVISPRLVNSFVGSSSWYTAIFGPRDVAGAVAAFPAQWLIYDGGANGGYFAQMGGNWNNSPSGRNVGQLQLTDDLSWSKGSHSLKFGVNYKYNRVTDFSLLPRTQAGTYTFNDITDWASGALTTGSSNFAQRYTPFQNAHVRLYNVGFYAQDEWAVTHNMKLTAGLRLERTGNPSCTDSCFERLVSPFDTLTKGSTVPYNQSIITGQKNAYYAVESLAILPRVGFSYNPRWSKKTVLRGGIGLFADLAPATLVSNAITLAPNAYTPTIVTGTVNTGGAGSAPAITAASAAAFQNGFKSGSTLAQLQAAVAPATFGAPAYFSGPSTLINPKYIKWSFEIQHEVTPNNVLSVSYVGNHGYNLLMRNSKANAYVNTANFPNGFGGLPTAAPDTRFTAITQLNNDGYSNYEGLTVALRRGLGFGFQGQVSYTWSHALDTMSNGGVGEFYNYNDSVTVQVNPIASMNYGNADYDIRHNVMVDFTWEIPVKTKNKLAKAVFDNWQLGSKWFIRGGAPFSVINSKLPSRVGSTRVGGAIIASVSDSSIARSCTDINKACFTTSQFLTSTTQTTWGNVGRNFFRGPGYFDIDLTVYKMIPIGERIRFRIGAQAYNFMNHPSFANPASDAGTPGLGTISLAVTPPTSPYGSFQGSAVSGRVVVLTGKFDF